MKLDNPLNRDFLLKDYKFIETDKFSGLVLPKYSAYVKSPEIAIKLEELLEFPGGLGNVGERLNCGIHARVLKAEEILSYPANRFLNNVWLHILEEEAYFLKGIGIPRPIGIIYEKNFEKLFRAEGLHGVYLSEFIDGERAYYFSDWDEKKIREVIEKLVVSLRSVSKKRTFLIDFAPRDILVRGGEVFLVDNEDVGYNMEDNPEIEKKCKKMQKNIFGLWGEKWGNFAISGLEAVGYFRIPSK